MENKERGAILSGRPISDEIVLSFPMRYNPEQSVLELLYPDTIL